MEKETIMIFKKKNGFSKEMNLPSIPFQPIRILVEDFNGDNPLHTVGSIDTPKKVFQKETTYQAKKIKTLIEYEEVF